MPKKSIDDLSTEELKGLLATLHAVMGLITNEPNLLERKEDAQNRIDRAKSHLFVTLVEHEFRRGALSIKDLHPIKRRAQVKQAIRQSMQQQRRSEISTALLQLLQVNPKAPRLLKGEAELIEPVIREHGLDHLDVEPFVGEENILHGLIKSLRTGLDPKNFASVNIGLRKKVKTADDRERKRVSQEALDEELTAAVELVAHSDLDALVPTVEERAVVARLKYAYALGQISAVQLPNKLADITPIEIANRIDFDQIADKHWSRERIAQQDRDIAAAQRGIAFLTDERLRIDEKLAALNEFRQRVGEDDQANYVRLEEQSSQVIARLVREGSYKATDLKDSNVRAQKMVEVAHSAAAAISVGL